MGSPDAVALLSRRISLALEEFAQAIEVSMPEAEPLRPEAELPDVQGKRQQEILALDGLRADRGLSTVEVAEQIDYDPANAYATLRGLQGKHVIELVPGAKPQRWRLVSRYRLTADRYLAVAALIRPGEWATLGDISLAVRGDLNAEAGVGRAVASRPDFPAPWRVLDDGGGIPAHWRDADGRGPEQARRLLEEDGVAFDDRGRAHPAHRVTWDVLRKRAERIH